MGAIQGAINKALGASGAAAAGAANMVAAEEAAAEHAAKEAAIKEEQGLLAKEQYHEASGDLTKLEGEMEETKNLWGEAQGDLAILEAKKPGGKGNTKAALEKQRAKKMTDIEAAEKAFKELQDKIEAKKAMMSRAEKVMKRTGTWGGMK